MSQAEKAAHNPHYVHPLAAKDRPKTHGRTVLEINGPTDLTLQKPDADEEPTSTDRVHDYYDRDDSDSDYTI